MIIFKSYFTYSPTMEKVTTSKHYNLTGNLCEIIIIINKIDIDSRPGAFFYKITYIVSGALHYKLTTNNVYFISKSVS